MQRILYLCAAIMLTFWPYSLSSQEARERGFSRSVPTDSLAEHEVLATDAARRNAMVHSDFAALDTLLGADLTYTHNDGTHESKSVFLSSLRSGEITYLALEPDSVLVRVYGSTAIADGRILLRARLDKKVGSFRGRFLEVYVRRREHWELVAWQSTRLTDVVWETQ